MAGAAAASALTHADALEGLDALPIPLGDLDVDADGVPHAKFRTAGLQALTVQFVDDVGHRALVSIVLFDRVRIRGKYISRSCQQIGSPGASAGDRLLAPPAVDGGVVTGEEHVRDAPAAERGRAG